MKSNTEIDFIYKKIIIYLLNNLMQDNHKNEGFLINKAMMIRKNE